MTTNPTTMTTGEIRFSYLHVFQPYAQAANAEPKYSTTILVPKSDAATKAAIDAAVRAAIDNGVTKCWNGVRPPQPSICVHDGDGGRPSDGTPYGQECRGHWVITASSKNPPFVVDANVQPILQQSEVYSGMYGRASITFFPYANSGKKGVGCALNGIQKLRDGEPLSGRVSAEDAFGAPGAPAAYAAPAAQQAAPPWGAMPAGYPQIDPITGQPVG